jgi:hypothetical protein
MPFPEPQARRREVAKEGPKLGLNNSVITPVVAPNWPKSHHSMTSRMMIGRGRVGLPVREVMRRTTVSFDNAADHIRHVNLVRDHATSAYPFLVILNAHLSSCNVVNTRRGV